MATSEEIKYPNVTVRLIGTDSNVFALIGRVSMALRQQVSSEAAAAFVNESTQCEDYDAVLRLIQRTVTVK